MTLAVVWYREKFGELWCAADTRISGAEGVVTDSGPKIFPVPVICHEHLKETKWRVCKRHSFGFVFAGNTLSATSTHALASACTQNFAQKKGYSKPVSLESIAQLYAEIGECQVKDMSFRSGGADGFRYLFTAVIFGFCPSESRYMAFVLSPSMPEGVFRMAVKRIVIEAGRYFPIGSGEADFVALMGQLEDEPEAGVMTTFREMVKREVNQGVGGHLQIGVATKQGFKVVPVLDTSAGPGEAVVRFLGWNSTDYKGVDGYTIGYRAIKP
ncbi:hypothetical protein [Pseudomonas sp. GL-B-19]|uniref:hypothetical protein n=1 Tax=Pseudomonas sp. GL-B-19 TaxID=2832393 RepID=UPI001CC07A5C|nr:hypothetical protein [Pseudomonas sp. GL-B-19]